MPSFFSQLFKNLLYCFSPRRLPWHLLAIVFTYILATSGFDWWWFTRTRGVGLQAFLFPAVAVGGLMPFVAPVVAYAWGKIYYSRGLTCQTPTALGQAAILGFLVSGFYKSLTGRIQPPLRQVGGLINNSLGFRFGFWRGGVFWGWPSTHTTVAFAMGVTLYMMLPKNKTVRFLPIVYALYVGIGVSTSIHWFSDFVAGAILGTVIGVVVGSHFISSRSIPLSPRERDEG